MSWYFDTYGLCYVNSAVAFPSLGLAIQSRDSENIFLAASAWPCDGPRAWQETGLGGSRRIVEVTVEMSDKEPNSGLFGQTISVVGCFQAVEGKTVFYINQFMRINKFPDEIRSDVIDTIREMLPNVCIIDDQ